MVSPKTLFATIFAAVMVASMIAPTAGAAAAMDATGGDAIDAEALGVDSDVQPQTEPTNESDADGSAEIAPALRSASDETVVVIAVERDLDLRAASADGEVSIDRIRDDSMATQEPVVEELSTLGANVRNQFWAGNLITAEIDLDEVDVERLAAIDRVKSVSPNVRYERPDPPSTADAVAEPASGEYTYGLEQINVPEFEDEFGTQGEGATVMIGDDGISNPEAGHPDLEFAKEAIVSNGTVDEGTLVGGAAGSHGEHTAGTATGAADPAGDVPRYGVAPEAGDAGMAALDEALPAEHRAFLEELALTHRPGAHLFVHAGVRPGVPLADQDRRDLTWIRQPFLSHGGDFGAMVVHGHTITLAPDARANRIGIDTGAYETGRLTALVLEGADQRFLST